MNVPQNNWRISRRTMLRGIGAAMALPVLEAMAPATARAAIAGPKPPVRMACMYFPNGVWLNDWVPQTAGKDYTIPYSLEPLAPFKSKLNVLSGLDKAASHGGDGHYAKTANFLTGEPVVKTTGKDIGVGDISMDQLAARELGHLTPLPSLELGIDPVISGIDSNVGYTRLYGSYISWRNATTPVAKEINPRFAYERLFGAKDEAGRSLQPYRDEDNRSLLDMVLRDAVQLRAQLGRDDQVKLDEYLESVRAVEKRIEFAMKPDPRDWKPENLPVLPTAPGEKAPVDFREHVTLMLDLMALAFQTDSTRVLSFMFANDVSGRNFSFLPGVSGGHHDMSHHEKKEEKTKAYAEITRWHSAQLAYLLTKLDSIREGDGTLLDNCMILFGSSISDGDTHRPSNLPIIVAGGASGGLKTGQHVACAKDTPLCNLYISMLNAFGVPTTEFGDGKTPISELMPS